MTTVIDKLLALDHGLIPNLVNDSGTLLPGAAMHMSQRAPVIFEEYANALRAGVRYGQIVPVWPDDKSPMIVHCFAVKGLVEGKMPEGRPLVYTALMQCFLQIRRLMLQSGRPLSAVYIPHGLGSGPLGGNWSFIKDIIDETLPEATIIMSDPEEPHGRN